MEDDLSGRLLPIRGELIRRILRQWVGYGIGPRVSRAVTECAPNLHRAEGARYWVWNLGGIARERVLQLVEGGMGGVVVPSLHKHVQQVGRGRTSDLAVDIMQRAARLGLIWIDAIGVEVNAAEERR